MRGTAPTLRWATIADAPAIATLDLAGRGAGEAWSRQSWIRFLSNRRSRVLVAEDAGRCVATVAGRLLVGEGEILVVVVAPARRRQGLGRRLLERWLASLEVGTEVWLEVRAGNLAARHLYEEVGFRVAGRRPAYYHQPTEDALIYRRRSA